MNNIKKLRLKKKMTQEYLARQLNISLRYFQKIENGESIPNVYLGIEISKILGENISEIFPLKEKIHS